MGHFSGLRTLCPNLGHGEKKGRKMAELKKANLMAGLFGEEEVSKPTDSGSKVDTVINIDKLKDFHSEIVQGGKKHPWSTLSDQKKAELEKSIKEHGILQPIVVRRDVENGYYEILAGHNRRDACKAIGKYELSVNKGEIVIREDLDTIDAADIMLDTNIHRDEIPIMDKAWACRIKLEIIKKRVSQLGTQGKRSDEIAADELQMSRNNVQRYARLTYIIRELQELTGKNKLPINVGVELSYLSENQQKEVYKVWEETCRLPSLEQAKSIRLLAQKEFVNEDDIFGIIAPEKQLAPIKLAFKTAEKKFRKIDDATISKVVQSELEELISETVERYISNL